MGTVALDLTTLRAEHAWQKQLSQPPSPPAGTRLQLGAASSALAIYLGTARHTAPSSAAIPQCSVPSTTLRSSCSLRIPHALWPMWLAVGLLWDTLHIALGCFHGRLLGLPLSYVSLIAAWIIHWAPWSRFSCHGSLLAIQGPLYQDSSALSHRFCHLLHYLQLCQPTMAQKALVLHRLSLLTGNASSLRLSPPLSLSLSLSLSPDS